MKNQKLIQDLLILQGYTKQFNQSLYEALEDLGYSGQLNSMMSQRLSDIGYVGGMSSKLALASKDGFLGLLAAEDSPIISGTFNEGADTYNLTTDHTEDGVWVWARTATGVTLTSDGSGGWTGGLLLSSGTQVVGADGGDVEFDEGGDATVSYKLHVYQRTSGGKDSNVLYTDYVKNAPPGATPVIVGTPVNSQNGNTNNLTVTLPTTRTIGDWEYIIVSHSDDRLLYAPVDFTEITLDTYGTSGVLNIRAYGREITADNVAETTAAAWASGYGSMNAFAVETTGNGFGASGSGQVATGNTTHTGIPITTEQDGSLLFEAMAARVGDSGTADYAYSLTNNLLMVNTQVQETAGLSTGTTFVSEWTTSTWSPALTFEVKA